MSYQSQLYSKFTETCVRLYAQTESGCYNFSGNFISSCGIILTNSALLTDFINGNYVRRNIFAEVLNINGTNKKYFYEASILGIDGAGNIGVLQINPNLKYNRDRPKLVTQKYLKWGSSEKSISGTDVYRLSQNIICGKIINNRSNDNTSVLTCLHTDLKFDLEDQGSSLINSNGEIIGIQNTVNGGVISEIAQDIVETIIHSKHGPRGEFLKFIKDSNGYYLRYQKGWFGLRTRPMIGSDLLPFVENKKLEDEIQKSKSYQELGGIYVEDISEHFNGPLKKGDLIVSVNNIRTGAYENQVPITYITWNLLSGSKIRIVYRKKEDAYQQKYSFVFKLDNFPNEYDFSDHEAIPKYI